MLPAPTLASIVPEPLPPTNALVAVNAIVYADVAPAISGLIETVTAPTLEAALMATGITSRLTARNEVPPRRDEAPSLYTNASCAPPSQQCQRLNTHSEQGTGKETEKKNVVTSHHHASPISAGPDGKRFGA